ncbi:MAG: energy transducer TonB [Pseudomonadota bacterium]
MSSTLRALCVALFLFTSQSYASEEQDADREAVLRAPPAYPAACAPPEREVLGPQSVTLQYDINSYGLVENFRILESTHSCFHEAVLEAVKYWRYGRNKEQSNVETTFTFILQEDTQAVDFDARPVYRTSPKYPRTCIRHAEQEERVIL